MIQKNFTDKVRDWKRETEDFKTPQVNGKSSLRTEITFSDNLYDYQINMAAGETLKCFDLILTPVNGQIAACNMKVFYSINNPDVMSSPAYPAVTAPAAEVRQVSQEPPYPNYRWSILCWNNLPAGSPIARTIYLKIMVDGTDYFTHTLTPV